MESTGYILAAAGIAAANEAVFIPASQHKPLWQGFNWRIVPATGIAVVTFAGLEKMSPPFAKGLAILALMYVLMTPSGGAPSPVENAYQYLQSTKGR